MDTTVFCVLTEQKYINSKAKYSVLLYPFCFGNILKGFSVDNITKLDGMDVTINIISRYLKLLNEKKESKTMFGFI